MAAHLPGSRRCEAAEPAGGAPLWAAKYVPALMGHLDHATMAWADRFRGSSLVSSAVISAWTDGMLTQPPTMTAAA